MSQESPEKERQLQALLLPFLVYLGIAVVFAPDAAVGSGVFWHHDFRHHHYPWRAWAAEQWAAGSVPWWSPGAANGFPLLAEGQGGFLYVPTMLLFLLLPDGLALNWSVLGHQVLAALGMHLFLRAMGLRGLAPYVGGVAWAWSGFLISHSLYLGMQNAAAWLGWALWGALTGRWWMVALSVGLMGVAGHPQAAAFGGLMLGLHALTHLRGTAIVKWGAAVAVGGLMAAPQLVASLELSQFSMREGGVGLNFAHIGSLPPQELINAVLPTFFGFDRPADVEQTYYHRGWGYWGSGENHWEMCFYLGIPAVLLALLGAWRPTVRGRGFFVALGLGGLVLMLGGPLWDLVRLLPGFGFFRFPARFAMWVTFSCAVLAAMGAARVQELAEEDAHALSRLTVLIAVLFSLGTGAGFLVVNVAEAPLRAKLEGFFSRQLDLPPPPELGPLQKAALPQPEPEDAALIPYKVDRVIRGLRWSFSPRSPGMLWPFTLLVLTALALPRPRWLVPLVGLDLWALGHSYHPRVPASMLDERPAWLADAMTQPGGPRTTVIDRRVDPALDTSLLSASLGLLYGTSDVIIPSPLLLVRNEAMLATMGLDVGDKGAAKVRRYLTHIEVARRMGVRFLATTHTIPGLLPVAKGAVNVFMDAGALPRARVVPCVRYVASVDEAFALIEDTDPRLIVIVEGEGTSGCFGADGSLLPLPDPEAEPPALATGTATIGSYLDQSVAITATGPGYLVLADSWYPRWSAQQDGAPVPILQADVLFRAIPLKPGEQSVVFSFDPGLPGKLLPLSALLLLGVIGVGVAAERRRGPRVQ